MGLIGWLVALGCLFIGAAIGIWGYTEFNKLVAVWAIGVPGAILLVAAGGFELQAIALANEKPKVAVNDRRAYVFPSDADVANPDGNPATVAINIKNSGQSPAYELTWRCQFAVAMVGGESEIAIDPVDAPKQTLPVGQSLSYLYTFSTWGPALDALLSEGKAAIYAKGEIRYKDADGIDRYTDFLLKSGGRFGIKTGVAPGKFSAAYLKSN